MSKTLLETLTELTGSAEVAESVQKALGEYMIPKVEHRKVLDKLKEQESEYENFKKSQMSEAELHKLEIENAKKIKSEYGVKVNALEVERLFAQNGLGRDDYKDLLDTIVSEDSEKSLASANRLIGLLNKQKEVVATQTKQGLIDQTKSPENGNPPTPAPTRKIPTVI